MIHCKISVTEVTYRNVSQSLKQETKPITFIIFYLPENVLSENRSNRLLLPTPENTAQLKNEVNEGIVLQIHVLAKIIILPFRQVVCDWQTNYSKSDYIYQAIHSHIKLTSVRPCLESK